MHPFFANTRIISTKNLKIYKNIATSSHTLFNFIKMKKFSNKSDISDKKNDKEVYF
jgi:hypothetical protein